MQYKIENDTLIPAPVNFKTPTGWICNFNLNIEAMNANGYTLTEADAEEWREAHPEPEPDRTDFDASCVTFRAVCAQIGEAIGVQNFRGGFDEMSAFSAHPVSDTLAGVKLAVAWSAANELCVYEGRKIGLGQPDWWYDCWKQNTEA